MNQKIFSILIITFSLTITVQKAFAWTGVTGQSVDSVTNQGWVHGGDVYILNNATGDIEGTGTLATDGTFTINYGSDGLACGCVNLDATPPALDSSMSIFIIYNNGGMGTPGTGQVDYTEESGATNFDAGFIPTGTDPLAISLQSVVTTHANPIAPWMTAIILLVLTSTIVIVRRHSRRSGEIFL